MADVTTDPRGPMTACLMFLLALGACKAASAPLGPPPGNQPPVVTIISPAPNATVTVGAAVTLAGGAIDAEDGPLSGSALTWTSSRDGALGSGDTIVTSTLSIGVHLLTLHATDHEGGVGQSTRTLTVADTGAILGLQPVVGGLSSPVFLTAPPGDTGRLFIVEKTGTIRIAKHGVLLAAPFLDLTDSVTTDTEQGLLGLAFAPDYATSGRFYVSYTNPHGAEAGGTSVIARYHVSANADLADPASGMTLLSLSQPYTNHNGGMIVFGPDGFLYAGFGDGGGGGDPLSTGQDRTDLLASILRLDVSGSGGYTIPASNPYAASTVYRKELWAWGLRNPWRFSFDRQSGDLYIADVGQNAHEEVDVAAAASAGGANYGWNVTEGLTCYNAPTCDLTGITPPVLDYDHGQGCAVTGGYVYRGAAIPALQGHYLYADYCGGWVRSFRWVSGQAIDRQDRPTLSPGGLITSFGEDARGELYVLQESGTVSRIVQQ